MRIMNLYKLLRLSSICLLLVMVAGCTESIDFEQPQLTVSEKEIKFTNQIGEKSITVNTNCKEWVATTPKNWIHITQNGNKFVVKVDANTTGSERSSYILVDGGLAVEKIIVNQSAADLSLEIAKGEIILPQAGGTTMVDVNLESSMYENGFRAKKPDWLQNYQKRKNALKFISKTNLQHNRKKYKARYFKCWKEPRCCCKATRCLYIYFGM